MQRCFTFIGKSGRLGVRIGAVHMDGELLAANPGPAEELDAVAEMTSTSSFCARSSVTTSPTFRLSTSSTDIAVLPSRTEQVIAGLGQAAAREAPTYLPEFFLTLLENQRCALSFGVTGFSSR